MSLKARLNFKRFYKQAKKGNAFYQCSVGNAYINGNGVKVNYEQAVYWFQLAADQQYHGGYYGLAFCAENGFGMTKDINVALSYYEKAKKLGCQFSGKEILRINLSKPNAKQSGNLDQAKECYKMALQCSRNNQYVEAVSLYTRAAEMGLPEAQYELAVCYEEGCGIVPSRADALKWYQKAANNGYEKAKAALRRLNGTATPAPKATTSTASVNKPSTNATKPATHTVTPKATTTSTVKKTTSSAAVKTNVSSTAKKPRASATVKTNTVAKPSGKNYFPLLTEFIQYLKKTNNTELLAEYGDTLALPIKEYPQGNNKVNVTAKFFNELVQYTFDCMDKDSDAYFNHRLFKFAVTYQVSAGSTRALKNAYGEYGDGLYTQDDPQNIKLNFLSQSSCRNFVNESLSLKTNAFAQFKAKWGDINFELAEPEKMAKSDDYWSAKAYDDILKFDQTKGKVKSAVKSVVTYLWNNLNVVEKVRYPIEKLGRKEFRWHTEYCRVQSINWTLSFPSP